MAKLFSFVRLSENSNVASVKLGLWLSELLEIPAYWDESINADGPIDKLLIIGGAYGFAGSEVLASLGNAIENAKIVVWIQNDYTVIPPKDESGAESPFRAAFRNRFNKTGQPSVNFWTTVKSMSMPGKSKSGHRCGDYSRYFNWNALAYRPEIQPKSLSNRAAFDTLLYYGSYRKDREKYFERYLRSPGVPTIFSSLSKKTAEVFPLITRAKTSDIYQYAGEFGLGLYLEDRLSHDAFHSPGNRFYEMMSVGLPMVFQPESVYMLREAGYNVSDYVVRSPLEFPEWLHNSDHLWQQQRELWADKAEHESKMLAEQTLEAWNALP